MITVIHIGKLLRYVLISLFVIIAGFIVIKAFLPENAVSVFSGYRKLPIYSVDKTEKVTAVTFDCAWGSDDIPAILDTLKKEDIKATFFIVGQWAEKYPDAVRKIAADGHDIANHSYSHIRLGNADDSRIREEISKCDAVLKAITGIKPDLFRAPYGDYNDRVISIAGSLGYFTIQWSVDSLDWKPDISKDEISNRICSRISNGSIILFHNDTLHTAAILPGIILSLNKMGYSFLPVSKLIMRDNYTIDASGRQKLKE